MRILHPYWTTIGNWLHITIHTNVQIVMSSLFSSCRRLFVVYCITYTVALDVNSLVRLFIDRSLIVFNSFRLQHTTATSINGGKPPSPPIWRNQLQTWEILSLVEWCTRQKLFHLSILKLNNNNNKLKYIVKLPNSSCTISMA